MPDFTTFPDIRSIDDLREAHDLCAAWRVKVTAQELDTHLVQRLGCVYRPHNRITKEPDPNRTGSPLDTLQGHRRVTWTTDICVRPAGAKSVKSYGVVEFRGHRYYVCTD